METFTKKSFTSPRSLTYTYYDSAPAKPVSTSASTPVLFLLHGFPDTAHLWKKVVPHLSTLPNRIIIPDLLGSGTSSKPTSDAQYNSRSTSADLAALLASAGATRNVVAIGHDWGSYAAQRLWLWHPALLAGLGLLNVGYAPAARARFDLQAVNDAATAMETDKGKKRYVPLAYWEVLAAAGEEGAAVVDAHLESFWGVLHGEGEGWVREVLCVRGALRAFLEGDGVAEVKEYARPGGGWKEEWFAGVEEGGGSLAGAMGPYRAMVGNHQWEVEREIPVERNRVTVPTFFLACSGDDVGSSSSERIEEARASGLVPDLTAMTMDVGHWCTMEKPDEVGKALHDWLVEKFYGGVSE
ncbi:alpha beta hydrolase fold-1 protein [Diplodia corticola]|uniref:Alpha beta hydrolase fold-1 protein n=1 Tax=Diplodia corticola TaxID=236234 RepID=A0A1J9S5L9_9PEZI|nr:alpha beta hydrolase fold-1 protein [Diplodia corticola]OJD40259.1 alpha beta hydrolase fold-1 protein [Diplodia corticola]